MPEERIQKLNAIGFIWNKADALWRKRFAVLKQFVQRNQRTPKAHEKLGTDCIGQWYAKQLRYVKDGTLDEEKGKRLQTLLATTQNQERMLLASKSVFLRSRTTEL